MPVYLDRAPSMRPRGTRAQASLRAGLVGLGTHPPSLVLTEPSSSLAQSWGGESESWIQVRFMAYWPVSCVARIAQA
jgi:hypothetical protein